MSDYAIMRNYIYGIYDIWRYTNMSAKIVSILNEKGGCGKTTITMNLAGTIAVRHNKKILIIDGDTQAAATRWANMSSEASPFPCNVTGLAYADAKAHQSIRQFANDYDYIFIDCPPNKEAKFNASVLLVSNLAIVPFQPSGTDMWALDGTKSLIEAASVNNENLITKVLPNMCESRSSISREILDFFKSEIDMGILESTIAMRTIYRKVALSGEIAYQSLDAKAKNEMALLADEVVSLLE